MRASSIVGLAARAPVRGSVRVALAARTDPGAARRAWAAGPAVDAPRAPAARERRRHHVPRVRHGRLGLDASKVADPPPWAAPARKRASARIAFPIPAMTRW